MGLFINHHDEQMIYENKDPIHAPNQRYFRRDHLSELLREQQKASDLLYEAINHVKSTTHEHGIAQTNRWEEANDRLGQLQTMIGKDRLAERETLDKINTLHHSNDQVVHQVKSYQAHTEQINEKMLEQIHRQDQLFEQIEKQGNIQDNLRTRMDQQEARMEKILRKVVNFRSILFERTSFLSDKIEDNYHLTTTFIYNLLNGSDQLLTFYMSQGSKKESD